MKINFSVEIPRQTDHFEETCVLTGEIGGGTDSQNGEKTDMTSGCNITFNVFREDTLPMLSLKESSDMYDKCELNQDSYNYIRKVYSPFVNTPAFNQVNKKVIIQSKEKLKQSGLQVVVEKKEENTNPVGILDPMKNVMENLLTPNVTFDPCYYFS